MVSIRAQMIALARTVAIAASENLEKKGSSHVINHDYIRTSTFYCLNCMSGTARKIKTKFVCLANLKF